jgi:hypothetical protein
MGLDSPAGIGTKQKVNALISEALRRGRAGSAPGVVLPGRAWGDRGCRLVIAAELSRWRPISNPVWPVRNVSSANRQLADQFGRSVPVIPIFQVEWGKAATLHAGRQAARRAERHATSASHRAEASPDLGDVPPAVCATRACASRLLTARERNMSRTLSRTMPRLSAIACWDSGGPSRP